MPVKIVIKVNPGAGRQLCTIDKNGTLKYHIKSPPEQGKANAELIGLVAKKLNLPKDKISVLLGATSRTKTLLIDTNLSVEAITTKLCDHLQTKIG